jgi:hypothetical protein
VSVLLRQPHGFEGVSTVEKHLEPAHLSVSHSDDVGKSRLYRGLLSLRSIPLHHEDQVAVGPGLDNALRLAAELIEDVEHRREEFPIAAAATKGGLFRHGLWRYELSVVTPVLNNSVNIASIEGRVACSDSLHVLLRHA